jgi:large subunit ribosomal protein L6
MSKIGKKPLVIPQGVVLTRDVEFGQDVLKFKGVKGEVILPILKFVSVDVKDDTVAVSITRKLKQARANWGTMVALIKNALQGVTTGFTKQLTYEGVGYRASMKGDDLELNVGYSHPVLYKTPESIVVSVEKNIITVSGIDKARVGQVAAEIRKIRKPEPYKGSGIRYVGEVIRRKAGKKAATTAS